MKEVFLSFPHYLEADVGMVFQVGHDRFLPNRIQLFNQHVIIRCYVGSRLAAEYGSCPTSDGYSPASHRCGSGLSPGQVICHLWWRKQYFGFHCQFSFHRLLHTGTVGPPSELKKNVELPKRSGNLSKELY
jgi:hypothetical protein